jgi:hypothetical protein
MIRTVNFISRRKAESLPARADRAIISISEPESTPAQLACDEHRILRLVFHDVVPGGEGGEGAEPWTLFDVSHAEQVMHFVRRLHAEREDVELVIHCRAGISRSAALALFVAADTGCAFPNKPFAGLANRHVLSLLEVVAGRSVSPPRALPKQETFSVSVRRDFDTGQAEVVVENTRTAERVVMNGPMLEVPELAAQGIERVWGIRNPPPSHHVSDWENLT